MKLGGQIFEEQGAYGECTPQLGCAYSAAGSPMPQYGWGWKCSLFSAAACSWQTCSPVSPLLSLLTASEYQHTCSLVAWQLSHSAGAFWLSPVPLLDLWMCSRLYRWENGSSANTAANTAQHRTTPQIYAET